MFINNINKLQTSLILCAFTASSLKCNMVIFAQKNKASYVYSNNVYNLSKIVPLLTIPALLLVWNVYKKFTSGGQKSSPQKSDKSPILPKEKKVQQKNKPNINSASKNTPPKQKENNNSTASTSNNLLSVGYYVYIAILSIIAFKILFMVISSTWHSLYYRKDRTYIVKKLLNSNITHIFSEDDWKKLSPNEQSKDLAYFFSVKKTARI